jgi:transposase
LISYEAWLGLPDYQITELDRRGGRVQISVRYTGTVVCPHCQGQQLRVKDKRVRTPRHETVGIRHTELILETRKYQCRDCRRNFWQRFPGLLPHKRATEPFRKSIFLAHRDGINRSRLGRRENLGAATVERWFQEFLLRDLAQRQAPLCPRILGIDEHFFSRKDGYATTFCDLHKHRIFDVVLGRSEAALDDYLTQLPGKDRVRVVCIDLSSSYRALIRKHFPNARIVADRFHVIRLITHHFLASWREIDPTGSQHRGLLSLLRRHRHNLKPAQAVKLEAYFDQFPALRAIYRFKQRLCYLLLNKHRTRRQCGPLAQRFLKAIHQLRHSGLAHLVALGETLSCWRDEIACMWRFTKNNGITEGFHTKMEMLQRQAFGFRNFSSYRLRVKMMCS